MRRSFALAFISFVAGTICVAQAQLDMTGIGEGGFGSGGVAAVTLSNPPAYIALSGGNLVATSSASSTWGNARTTTSHATGKYFFEVLPTATSLVGFANSTEVNSSYQGSSTNSIGILLAFSGSMQVFYNNVSTFTYSGSTGGGAPTGVVVDMGAKLACFTPAGSSGAYFGSQATATCDPVTQANMLDISGVTGALFAGVSLFQSGDVMTANFGATSYTNTPPTGYGNW